MYDSFWDKPTQYHSIDCKWSIMLQHLQEFWASAATRSFTGFCCCDIKELKQKCSAIKEQMWFMRTVLQAAVCESAHCVPLSLMSLAVFTPVATLCLTHITRTQHAALRSAGACVVMLCLMQKLQMQNHFKRCRKNYFKKIKCYHELTNRIMPRKNTVLIFQTQHVHVLLNLTKCII